MILCFGALLVKLIIAIRQFIQRKRCVWFNLYALHKAQIELKRKPQTLNKQRLRLVGVCLTLIIQGNKTYFS